MACHDFNIEVTWPERNPFNRAWDGIGWDASSCRRDDELD